MQIKTLLRQKYGITGYSHGPIARTTDAAGSYAHLSFEDDGKQQAFMQEFSHWQPKLMRDGLTLKAVVVLEPRCFMSLTGSTLKQVSHEQRPLKELYAHLDALRKIQRDLEKVDFRERLDLAHRLSLDITPTSGRTYSQTSAYALSLRIYAEFTREDLSDEEYYSLTYASHMLADYDHDGNLHQSLKSDTNFVDYLRERWVDFRDSQPGEVCLSDDTPQSRSINEEIETNLQNILLGNPNVPIGRGATMKMNRFVPDHTMQSETDEILLSAGGMFGHSAIVRIVKVGRLADGSEAGPFDMPLYFDYYRIENNLGAGCHHPNHHLGTCAGTYITKLQPTVRDDVTGDTEVRSDMDPVANPWAYQLRMELTIKNLIRAERQLMFYRPVFGGPNGEVRSSRGSREADEWEVLNKTRDKFIGIPYYNPVKYKRPITAGTNQSAEITAITELDYMQQAGSCMHYSQKSLVTSVIGRECAMLHTDTLQAYDAELHIYVVNLKISELESEIEEQEQQQRQQPINQHGFFKQTTTCPITPLHDALNAIGVTSINNLREMILCQDMKYPSLTVLKLGCRNEYHAGDLARDIENLTTSNPPVIVTRDNEVILGQGRRTALYKYLGIDSDFELSLPCNSASPSI